MIYRTKDGDVLDQLCVKHYGGAPHRVEDAAEERPTIRLWD